MMHTSSRDPNYSVNAVTFISVLPKFSCFGEFEQGESQLLMNAIVQRYILNVMDFVPGSVHIINLEVLPSPISQ
jgi:hypothetical protein